MMRTALYGVVSLTLVALLSAVVETQSPQTMTTKEDFLRAMDELSNWGRWGDDDELGAANLITPEKRRQHSISSPNRRITRPGRRR